MYTLSVVRLADPLHAVMGMLNVSVGRQSWTVCGSNSTQSTTTTNSSLGTSGCDPAQPMTVNVSANAEVVMLQPTLLVPGVSSFQVFCAQWQHVVSPSRRLQLADCLVPC